VRDDSGLDSGDGGGGVSNYGDSGDGVHVMIKIMVVLVIMEVVLEVV